MQLRDIRATLADHSTRFDRLEKGFDRLFVRHALGLGATTELKTRELDGRQDQSEARHKRMDERVSDIERRLARVEEKLDG